MLHAAASHHQPQQQIPTPPMDIYASYLYQQQFINNGHILQQSSPYSEQTTAEVLDLSKRCDSIETPQTPRKTPSPCHTSSNVTSPFSSVGSPSQCEQLLTQRTELGIPANLIYSAQAQQQTGINFPSLYPALYGAPFIKEEPNISSTSSTPPPTALIAPAPTLTQAAVTPLLPQLPHHAPNTNFLQTIAAAAAATSAHINAAAQQRHVAHAPLQHAASSNNGSAAVLISTPNSPTNSNALLAASEAKSAPRPFKSFHRDPLVIAANFTATDALLDNPRIERYAAFRKRILKQMKDTNGGSRTVSNPKMRRTQSPDTNSTYEEPSNAEESSDCDISVGNLETNGCAANAMDQENDTDSNERNSFSGCNGQLKDAAYYERRRKNNAAAKKSRDRRRIKEDEIAIRASYLERQNIELLCQIDSLKAQLAACTGKLHT